MTSATFTRGPLAGLPREVGVLAGVAFCVALGFGIVAPAIPVFARQFGVSKFEATAVISAFALMRLVSAQFCGRLVERVGERLLLGVGIGVVAVSSAVAGLAQTYVQLLLLRGVGGIGSAMFTVSASTLLLRLVPSANRGRALSTFSSGFLFGGVAGPAVGGLVTAISLRLPFFLYAGTLLAAGTVGLVLLPRPTQELVKGPVEPASLTVRAALRLPAFQAALTANLAQGWAALGVRAALVPLFVTEGLGQKAIWTGIGFALFTAADAVTLNVGGRFADRRGRRPVLIGGCLIGAAGSGLLVLPGSLPLLLAAMLVAGAGAGLLTVAPGAVAGDLAGKRGGRVIATFQMGSDVGLLAGPLVAGYLADTISFGAAFAASSLVLLLAAGFAARAPETLRAASEPAVEPTVPEVPLR